MASTTAQPNRTSHGLLLKADPLKHERNLATAVIFQAWREAVDGDPSAFSFGLDPDSNLPFWCHVCGLDIEATRTCFRRLKNGEHTTPPLIIETRRKHAQYVFTPDEAAHAVDLFVNLRQGDPGNHRPTRHETYTWIALDMGKHFEVIERLLMVLHKSDRDHRRLAVELPDGFQEAWVDKRSENA